MSKKTLLIDADIMIYQIAAINEEHYEWEEGVVSEEVNEDKAKADIDTFIERLLVRCKAKDYILCLSSDYNFRYLVDGTYKGNRSDAKRPVLLSLLKSHVSSNYPCKMTKWLEADDVMGILGTSRENTIICTLDKDLNQIPGFHYNWTKDSLYEVSPEEGEFFFYQQVLTGDSVDGYSGCPGIGPVKARKALEASEDYWATCVSVYESKGLTEASALSQARLAKILTVKEWDFKNRTYKLWEPPKGVI